MKTYIKWVGLLSMVVIVCGLQACKNPQSKLIVSQEEKPTIALLELEKEKIKNTLVAMWSAIEKEDMAAYAGYIHNDFTQFGETDSILRVGKEAELEGIAAWISNAENIQTEMLDPKVTIVGDMGYITYYWSDKGTENGVPFSTRGKSTRIFVKEQGKWLCIHGHYTLLP